MRGWLIVVTAIAYVMLLFAVASIGDRRAAARGTLRSRPVIYALSLAIYCTSWTFFGSVGLATEHGPEFLTIYTGPMLVFVFAMPLLRRIIGLVKSEKITSIADFLAARYGKSFAVGSVAAVIATIGTIPYIALQLKAISDSVNLMVEHYNPAGPSSGSVIGDISLFVAFLLALFAVLFGTRHTDATEHQDGLVLAIAVELVVKLAAFLTIGIAVSFFLFGGPSGLAAVISANRQVQASMAYQTSLSTWIVVGLISAFAIVMLPRQFYMMFVENRSPADVKTAAWLFPLYMILINLFVMPIAFAGLVTVGTRTIPDVYMISLPLQMGHDLLAVIAFVGGFSAATAMVIVASVALSIMISNDIIIPLFLRRLLRPDTRVGQDCSAVILNIRRASTFLILLAAFLYYRATTQDAQLTDIGLLSFAAIAQFAPALIGGMAWRGANARGAVLGMCCGIAVWAYTLLLPSMAQGMAIVLHGPFGLAALRPEALFGTGGDPLNHGVVWSLAVNTFCFVFGSMSRASRPLERIQAAIFVPRDTGPMPRLRRLRTAVTVNDLKDIIARYLGVERTERSFESFAHRQKHDMAGGDRADMPVINFSEQLLAGAIGSSSARLVLSLLFQRHDGTVKDAFRLLDDASEALQHNRDLLQVALDQMEQGVTVFDQDFRLTCWNRQFRTLFGLPEELEQVGVSLARILAHLAERGDIACGREAEALDRLTMFAEPWQLEMRATGRIFELRSNPMPGGGMVATYADITARVAAELTLKRANETLEQSVNRRTTELVLVNEELAQAQHLAEEANLGKTRFLAAVGHDILQPLNAARLYASSLLERMGKSAESETVMRIESSLESVEAILAAVLDISRLDAGALKPSRTVFRLDAMIRQIASDFMPAAAAKHLDLRIVPTSLAVATDRNLLRRLVQNLVSNAVKYTRRGRILVGARRRGGLIELQIIDTGIGIAEGKLDTVFREFTRLEEGTREADGLGLGLSIVDRIARVLRLEIRLQSKAGHGTRFSVLIPASKAVPADENRAHRATSRPDFALDGLSVLSIDNDLRILDGMRLLLQGWGCRVVTASGGAALEDVRPAAAPDVILVDYHLDGENGLDIVRQLRGAYGRDIPALLLTADRSSEVRAAAASIDVLVLNKPVKPAALRAMLSRCRRGLVAAE